MKVFLLLICFGVGLYSVSYGQDDSLLLPVPAPVVQADTPRPKPVVKPPAARPQSVHKDTVLAPLSASAGIDTTTNPVIPSVSRYAYGDSIHAKIINHPFYTLHSAPENLKSDLFTPLMKDELFYAVCALLLYIGLLHLGFPKYFSDLFSIFIRSSVRQNQLKDQLQQAGLANLLFNLFFVVSVSLFTYMGITYVKGEVLKPWLLFSICFFAVMFLYIGKFAILKVCGWMFGKTVASDTYIFIVFLVNKIMAILLLPFIIILAFSTPLLQQIAFTAAICLVIFLFLYRFVMSFSSIRNELKISGLHLFLYICGFEIMPVLVIYRIMLQLFERSS